MRTSWENEPAPRVVRATARVPSPDPANEPATEFKALAAALSLEVLGGVLGAVISLAFADSPAARTAGAFIGIAITALVTATGPFLRGRVTAAIGITMLALLITFTGGKAVEAAAPPGTVIFGSSDTPDPSPSPTGTSPGKPPSTPPSDSTCEGGLCIQVAPRALTCQASTCEPVVVTNPGRKLLQLGRIELTGAAAGDFKKDNECEGKALRPKQSCTITVSYGGASDGTAALVIHQNLKGPATSITVVGRGSGPSEPLPDLTISAEHLRCAVSPNGSLNGNDALFVFLSIRDVRAVPVEHLVPYNLVSDTGARDSGNSGISTDDAVTGMAVDLQPDDYGRKHTLVASVDPDNQIAEANEENNQLRVVVAVQSRPASPTDQPCHSQG